MIKLKDILGEIVESFGFHEYSALDYYSNQIEITGTDGKYKQYLNCPNNNLICEGSLSRLLSREDKDWSILTAYRKQFTKEENIKRNRILRGKLNSLHMGVQQLVGHWQECQLKGVAYKECPKDQLVDTIERSYWFARPDNISKEEFIKIVKDLMVIEGETQDAAVVRFIGDGVYLLFNNGELDKIGNKIQLNLIQQAYSQHVLKTNTPFSFIFEGVEIPGSNSGAALFKKENVLWI